MCVCLSRFACSYLWSKVEGLNLFRTYTWLTRNSLHGKVHVRSFSSSVRPSQHSLCIRISAFCCNELGAPHRQGFQLCMPQHVQGSCTVAFVSPARQHPKVAAVTFFSRHPSSTTRQTWRPCALKLLPTIWRWRAPTVPTSPAASSHT